MSDKFEQARLQMEQIAAQRNDLLTDLAHQAKAYRRKQDEVLVAREELFENAYLLHKSLGVSQTKIAEVMGVSGPLVNQNFQKREQS